MTIRDSYVGPDRPPPACNAVRRQLASCGARGPSRYPYGLGEYLLGRWVRSPDGSRAFREGALTALVRRGGVFVADELASARADLTSRLNALLDSRTLTLVESDGETIRAHLRFAFIATSNGGTDFGSRPLSARLRKRFGHQLRFDYSSRVDAILCHDERAFRGFHDLRHLGLRSPVSTRLIANYLRNRTRLGADLANAIVADSFGDDGRATVEKAFGSPTPIIRPSFRP
jgi:midasin (ATPase involved in ribosome maturation)